MGIISKFIDKVQIGLILEQIQLGINAPIVSKDQKDSLPGIEDSESVIGKINTSGISKTYSALYVYIAKIKAEYSKGYKIILKCHDDKYTQIDDIYSMDKDGITRMFKAIDAYFNIEEAHTENKSNKKAVGNMLEFDVLLKDFNIEANKDNSNTYDVINKNTLETIAHEVVQIDRYQTDKHVVFDLTCKEYMVLIIINKKTSEIKEIRTIGKNDKAEKSKFKAFIESDGVSFFEYSKTAKTLL